MNWFRVSKMTGRHFRTILLSWCSFGPVMRQLPSLLELIVYRFSSLGSVEGALFSMLLPPPVGLFTVLKKCRGLFESGEQRHALFTQIFPD